MGFQKNGREALVNKSDHMVYVIVIQKKSVHHAVIKRFYEVLDSHEARINGWKFRLVSPQVRQTGANRHEKIIYRSDTLPIHWIWNKSFELVAYLDVDIGVQNITWQSDTRRLNCTSTLRGIKYGTPSRKSFYTSPHRACRKNC